MVVTCARLVSGTARLYGAHESKRIAGILRQMVLDRVGLDNSVPCFALLTIGCSGFPSTADEDRVEPASSRLCL